MRVFASVVSRLFSLSRVTALAAAALVFIVTAGCGHHCGCNRCHKCETCNTCNTCNTCSTCHGVSEAPPPTTCTSCQQYSSGPGFAPQSLSEVPPPPATFTQASATTVTTTDTSFSRVGESQNLPVFVPQSAPAPQPATAGAAFAVQPATPSTPIPAPRSGGGQYHTLQKGETVYALSRQYNVRPKAILEANHFSDPNHLSVGTKVYIPAN